MFSRELTTILNSLYFCLTTFTTVGYGDIHAESVSGKIACFVLQSMSAILFLVVFAIVIGIVINREDHDV
ncbi:MAG: two pore domain potassium channel family protein [bacterium]|nr:two pore domain potassium channel family protein [bacterium]